jgi:hypothetical protein
VKYCSYLKRVLCVFTCLTVQLLGLPVNFAVVMYVFAFAGSGGVWAEKLLSSN